MNWISFVFAAALAVKLVVELLLAWRQGRSVAKHRGAVPAAFSDRVDLAAHQKAADYTSARVRVGYFSDVFDAALLLLFTLGGGVRILDEAWSQCVDGPVLRGCAVIFSLVIVSSLLQMPLSVYRTFVLEARFGFNKTTWQLFLTDLLKGALLSAALGLPIVAGVIALMESAGELWWLYTWAAWSAFSFLLLWLYPAFIAPLFNKFTPLADQAVLQRVNALLQRCGFKSQGVYVMNGSLRSSHGNAYFTGLGNNKRVVFFDTLLTTLDIEEVEGVLAHELGHFKLKHVTRRIAQSLVVTLISLALLGWTSRQGAFYEAFGGVHPASYNALLLFFLVVPTFTFLVSPFGAWMSRRDEYAADDFAAKHVDSKFLSRALVKLYRDNANTLTPDAWHSAFYDSHPAAPRRIAYLEAMNLSKESAPGP